MLVACWSSKGGAGTTVVAAVARALLLARRSSERRRARRPRRRRARPRSGCPSPAGPGSPTGSPPAPRCPPTPSAASRSRPARGWPSCRGAAARSTPSGPRCWPRCSPPTPGRWWPTAAPSPTARPSPSRPAPPARCSSPVPASSRCAARSARRCGPRRSCCVTEPGRALTRARRRGLLGAPVVAEVAVDPHGRAGRRRRPPGHPPAPRPRPGARPCRLTTRHERLVARRARAASSTRRPELGRPTRSLVAAERPRRAPAPARRRTVAAVTAEAVTARAAGLGPLEPLLADPAVTEVMVNGGGAVWIERAGRLERTDVHLARHARSTSSSSGSSAPSACAPTAPRRSPTPGCPTAPA